MQTQIASVIYDYKGLIGWDKIVLIDNTSYIINRAEEILNNNIPQKDHHLISCDTICPKLDFNGPCSHASKKGIICGEAFWYIRQNKLSKVY